MSAPRIGLVLGGGAARGLAHIGALEVLEQEGIEPVFLVGSSMGGLIAALYAAGNESSEILEMARGFRFPRWFLPGTVVPWDRIFRSAVGPLTELRFDRLRRRLAVVAVDLESGRRVVIDDGPVLPAVRATCAVPAVLPPVRIGSRWLADGGLVSVLPVDVASMVELDAVIAIEVGAPLARPIPSLHGLAWAIGQVLPNPVTARAGFEILVRAAEITLHRQNTLAAAMIGPEVLVRVDLGDLGLRDFHRLDEAVAAGRRAMEMALPELRIAMALPRSRKSRREVDGVLQIDPVCDMVVNPRRAAATIQGNGGTIHFCSTNCRDAYLRSRDGPVTRQ